MGGCFRGKRGDKANFLLVQGNLPAHTAMEIGGKDKRSRMVGQGGVSLERGVSGLWGRGIQDGPE